MAPGLAAAMASLFKKKTVDGESGAAPPALGGGPRRPSRSPGAAAPSPRTILGAELAPAWARGGAVPAGRARALCRGGEGTRRERRRPQPARGDSPAALGPGGAAGKVRRAGPDPGTARRGIPGASGPVGAAGPGRGVVGAGPW